jgi:hypothetical protein
VLEVEKPSDAFQLYREACAMLEVDSAEHYAMDTFRSAVATAIRANDLAGAVEMELRLVEVFQRNKKASDLHKAFLAVVVLLLAQNDYVGADKRYQAFLAFVVLVSRSRLRMNAG